MAAIFWYWVWLISLINDLRESPALDIIHLLKEKGAVVSYHDPYVPELNTEGIMMCSERICRSAAAADLVVIVTNHSKIDYEMVLDKSQAIFDCRNAMKGLGKNSNKVVKL